MHRLRRVVVVVPWVDHERGVSQRPELSRLARHGVTVGISPTGIGELWPEVGSEDGLRSRQGAQGVPDPRPRDRRRTARLPRLGQHVAEAPQGDRCDDRVPRELLRADQPQLVPARRRGDRRLRRCPPRRRPPDQRTICRRGDLHQERHRVDEPDFSLVGRRQPRRGRRRRAHPHGAPRQHRSVADAARRTWHRDPMGAAHRRRPARPHRPRPAPRRRQGVLVHGDEQRARHAATGRRNCAPPPTTPERSPSSTPASTSRTTPPTSRRGMPTSSRSPATRCAGRPASACCGAAWNCSTRCRRSSVAAT